MNRMNPKWMGAIGEGKTMVYSNYPYSKLFDQIDRKMLFDLEAGKIDIDEFRRISRGLNAVATYLDHKEK